MVCFGALEVLGPRYPELVGVCILDIEVHGRPLQGVSTIGTKPRDEELVRVHRCKLLSIFTRSVEDLEVTYVQGTDLVQS